MFEKLSKQKKLDRAKKLFMDAVDRDIKWQQDAREDFSFRDGDQWSEEEKQILKEELRPVLTFNLTKSSVDLIMGMNEDNKVVHRAAPFEPSDSFLCEVLNDLSDYFKESNDFALEEDGALESATVCGRGFVGIDFAPDPKKFGEIQITEVNIPVHEVHFDPSARRPNLEDASYIVWDRWLSKEDFKIKYPKVSENKMEDLIQNVTRFSNSSDPVSEDGIPISDPEDTDYEREMDSDINFYDNHKSMIRVVHMEYWEYYQRFYVFNPETGEFQEVPKCPGPAEKAAFLEEYGEELTCETMFDKRVKWLQFSGNEILYDDVAPLQYPGFSIVPVIAYRDVSMRTANHFGIVRLMKDPQREINKRWSQALNMLNQQVQPGVYAETDAFVDEQQALQSMKVAGDITYVNAGALTSGKIKERTVPTFPNAPMQMEQFSQDIMKKITGINPDLLGQDRGRQEPGVVVRLRQQQGMTLLKPLFRNFNTMKKELFKRQLAIIMTYMPDQQMFRVLGSNDQYAIDPESGMLVDTLSAIVDEESGELQGFSLMADIRDVRNLEYNIAAEEAPGNMTKRMLELQGLMEMSQILPVPPEQIIEKLDIGASDKRKWLEYIDSQQQAQQQQQEEMLAKEMEFRERELGQRDKELEQEFMVSMTKIKQMAEKDEKSMITKLQQMSSAERAEVRKVSAQMLQAAAQIESQERAAAVKRQQDLQNIEMDAIKATQDLGIDAVKARQDMRQDVAMETLNLRQAAIKHAQEIKFAKEKHELELAAAREKQRQAIALARQKAKEGEKNGKGKQTNSTKS